MSKQSELDVFGTENPHILTLEVRNFKRVKLVKTDINDGVTVVGGMNGQGKSSLLEAFEVLLAGGRSIPEEPVRRGESQAIIIATFPGVVVKRVINANKTHKLLVTKDDGTELSSPQAFLDSLVGKVAFDPLAFMRMSAKEKSQVLIEMAGLDLNDLNNKKAALYEQRTGIGRIRDDMKGHWNKMPDYDPKAPLTITNFEDIGKRLQEAQRHNRAIADSNNAYQLADEQCKDAMERVDRAKAELRAAEQNYAAKQSQRDNAKAACEMAGDPIPTDDFTQQLDEIESTNERVRNNQAWKKAESDFQELDEEYKSYTRQIDQVDADKRKRLAEVEFPMAGLEAHEDGSVSYNGFPIDQASGAEGLRLSTRVAMAQNPKLKVAIIRDGSLLDANGLRIIDEEVRAVGGQVLLERVGHDRGAHVIIVDGAMADPDELEADGE